MSKVAYWLLCSQVAIADLVGAFSTTTPITPPIDFGQRPVLPKVKEDFCDGTFDDIEHMLGMCALSFCAILGKEMSDQEVLSPLMSVVESCHICLLGYTPIISFVDAAQGDLQLRLTFTALGREHILSTIAYPKYPIK